MRARWIARGIRLHPDLCEPAAPVLGWGQEWDILATQTRRRLEPLADEADRRYLEPLQRAMAEGADDIA